MKNGRMTGTCHPVKSEDKIDKIKEQIPGLSTGFCSTAKPWTSEEQNSALQTKNFMDWSDSLLKTK